MSQALTHDPLACQPFPVVNGGRDQLVNQRHADYRQDQNRQDAAEDPGLRFGLPASDPDERCGPITNTPSTAQCDGPYAENSRCVENSSINSPVSSQTIACRYALAQVASDQLRKSITADLVSADEHMVVLALADAAGGRAGPALAVTPSSASALGELLGAIIFRCDYGELGCAFHVEPGIIGLHVVDYPQPRFAVIQA